MKGLKLFDRLNYKNTQSALIVLIRGHKKRSNQEPTLPHYNSSEQLRTSSQDHKHSWLPTSNGSSHTTLKTLDMWCCEVAHSGWHFRAPLMHGRLEVRDATRLVARRNARWSSGNCLLDPHRDARC